MKNAGRLRSGEMWQNQLLDIKKASQKLYGKDMAKAACLIPLCTVDKNPGILIIKRAPATVQQNFQYSFPGGAEEPGTDRCLQDAAIRETHEELLGLSKYPIEIWGDSLPELCDATIRYQVFSFVGTIDKDFTKDEILELKINKSEVEKVDWVSLEECLQDECFSTWQWTKGQAKHSVINNEMETPKYSFDCGAKLVGWPAMHLNLALSSIFPDQHKLHCDPVRKWYIQA